jgi:trigger factor
LSALVEELEVELPETLIQQEIRTLIEQTAGQIAQQGMDVKKLFTPDLVRSLMETSRPEAEQRLRRSLALQALAKAEAIEVAEADLETKIKEISRGLSNQGPIDPQRLRQAVANDLLQDKLLDWLEANCTVTTTAVAAPADSGEAVSDRQPESAQSDEAPEPSPAAAPTKRRS